MQQQTGTPEVDVAPGPNGSTYRRALGETGPRSETALTAAVLGRAKAVASSESALPDSMCMQTRRGNLPRRALTDRDDRPVTATGSSKYGRPQESRLAPGLPQSFNGRYLIQARVAPDLYVKARALSRTLGISLSMLVAELLAHVEVDENGQPVGWDGAGQVEPSESTDSIEQPLPMVA